MIPLDNLASILGILFCQRLKMKHRIDTDLITKLLRDRGHNVSHIIPVPDNGGEYEFEVDGNLLSLAETRGLLEREDERVAQAEAITPPR